MAFANTWDEAYPPGTLSADQIDTAIQFWAIAIRERMNVLLGIGTWATDTNATLSFAVQTFRGVNPYILPGSATLNIRDFTGGFNNAIFADAGDLTMRRNLIATNNVITNNDFVTNKAVGKLLPGITSFALRNFADSADNILITDAGIVSVRAQLNTPNALVSGQGTITRVDSGNTGGALAIDWNTSNNQRVRLTANWSPTFSNPRAGSWYTLECVQDGTGTRLITWPAAVIWPSGTIPVLTTTINKRDIIVLYYDGTNYLGAPGGFNYV